MASSRLRIAFIHQPWSIVRPGKLGADSVVLWTEQVAKRLAREHEVVCYSRLGEGLPPIERADGVEHRRVPGSFDRYIKFAFQKLDRVGLRDVRRPFFASNWAYRQFFGRVAADLASLKPDIVHIHNFSQFVPVARRAAPDATIGLHMHCEWLTQIDREIISRRLLHTDRVIGVSEFLAATIRARFPEYSEQIRFVHNGADVKRFDIDRAQRADRDGRATRTVLYVGRISPEKGIHTLLDAFAIVARQLDDVSLRIVGPERIVPYEMIVPFCDDPKVQELAPWFRPGAYMAHLRTQVAALPAGRVEMLEREVPHDELPRVYGDADIFAFPSIWDEPFGLPLVEAMSAGCATIATCGGAFPEIVENGVTGLVVERADPQALADAMARLCRDNDLRTRMAQSARRRARERFSWDHVAESLLREYRSAELHRAPAPAGV